jgi:RIO-like serine/threonine protein kinase
MKLDVNALRYLTKDDFRVLTAVEMGMRNVIPPKPCISISHIVAYYTRARDYPFLNLKLPFWFRLIAA